MPAPPLLIAVPLAGTRRSTNYSRDPAPASGPRKVAIILPDGVGRIGGRANVATRQRCCVPVDVMSMLSYLPYLWLADMAEGLC